jgi:hypothetical protein
MAQLDTMPGIDLDPRPRRTAEQALQAAIETLGGVPVVARDPVLVVLPVPTARRVEYHLAWELELGAHTGPSRRVVHVDAHDGHVLRWDEQLRFLDGTVLVEIDDRRPFSGLTTRPLAFAEVDGETGAATTDPDGVVDLPGGSPQRVAFAPGSGYFDVIPDETAEVEWVGELSQGGAVIGTPPSGNGAAVRRARAQADVHVFAHEVRAYSLGINPEFVWATQRVSLRVNINTANGDQVRCNAWFDGQGLNFVRQGSGCHNSARIQDVVYHEYGHGFHGYSIVEGAGGWGDGSLGEGLSDYLAASMNDDPVLAAGFYTGGQEPLRRLGPDLRWPEDIESDPHQTGLIIAGALWDLREALVHLHGAAEGVRLADRFLWHIAMRAADIEDSYVEVLLADDDNGNLDDGTPNQCVIDEAFGAHGLGPGLGPLEAQWRFDHMPASFDHDAGEPLDLRANIVLGNPLCADGEIGEVVLSWTDDAAATPDEFETVSMDLAGAEGGYEVRIRPAAGRFLRYRITAYDIDGEVVGRLPRGSITDPWFGVWVGEAQIHFESDLEADDAGFVHELLAGDPNTEGADDWQWGTPGGRGGDPPAAMSGIRVWGNDLSPQSNWNGLYQSDVVNILSSGRIDVDPGADDVHLQFQRWLTVEDGWFDRAEVRVNGTLIWSNFASDDHSAEAPADAHHLDETWAFRSYEVTHLVDDGALELEWRLNADSGLQFGGWNLDDVRVITAVAPQRADDDDPLDGRKFIAQGTGCACDAARRRPTLGLVLLPAVFAFRRRR